LIHLRNRTPGAIVPEDCVHEKLFLPRESAEAVPDAKAQRNFTDPETKIMKTSNKGFDQCGNAQAVANAQQIIIAADVTDQANDVRQTVPMMNQTITNQMSR
jgi:hypothetical protein